jgi:hypothetical protein
MKCSLFSQASLSHDKYEKETPIIMADVLPPSDDHLRRHQAGSRRDRQNTLFSRFLLSGDRRWISSSEQKQLTKELTTTRRLIRDAIALEKLSDADLWAKGVNPDHLKNGLRQETDQIIQMSSQIREHANSPVTQMTNGQIENLRRYWNRNQQYLQTLVAPFRATPQELQSEALQHLIRLDEMLQKWQKHTLINTSPKLLQPIHELLGPYEEAKRPDIDPASLEATKSSLPEVWARLQPHLRTVSQIIEGYDSAHTTLQRAIQTAREVYKQITPYIYWNNRQQYSELRSKNDLFVMEFDRYFRTVFDYRTKEAEASLPPKIEDVQASPQHIGQRIQQDFSQKAEQLEKYNAELPKQFENLKAYLYQEAQSNVKGAIKLNNVIRDQIVHYYKWINEINRKNPGKIGDFHPKPMLFPNELLGKYFDEKSSIEKLINKCNNPSTQRDRLTPKLWEKSKELEKWNPKLSDHLKAIEHQLETGIQAYLKKIKEQKNKMLEDFKALLAPPKDLADSVNKLADEADKLLKTDSYDVKGTGKNVSTPKPLDRPKKLAGRFDSLAAKSKELEEKFKELKNYKETPDLLEKVHNIVATYESHVTTPEKVLDNLDLQTLLKTKEQVSQLIESLSGFDPETLKTTVASSITELGKSLDKVKKMKDVLIDQNLSKKMDVLQERFNHYNNPGRTWEGIRIRAEKRKKKVEEKIKAITAITAAQTSQIKVSQCVSDHLVSFIASPQSKAMVITDSHCKQLQQSILEVQQYLHTEDLPTKLDQLARKNRELDESFKMLQNIIKLREKLATANKTKNEIREFGGKHPELLHWVGRSKKFPYSEKFNSCILETQKYFESGLVSNNILQEKLQKQIRSNKELTSLFDEVNQSLLENLRKLYDTENGVQGELLIMQDTEKIQEITIATAELTCAEIDTYCHAHDKETSWIKDSGYFELFKQHLDTFKILISQVQQANERDLPEKLEQLSKSDIQLGSSFSDITKLQELQTRIDTIWQYLDPANVKYIVLYNRNNSNLNESDIHKLKDLINKLDYGITHIESDKLFVKGIEDKLNSYISYKSQDSFNSINRILLDIGREMKNNSTLGAIEDLSTKILVQECKQKGRNLPTIIQHKLKEGMDKQLINKSLEKFYSYSLKTLEEATIVDRDKVRNLISLNIVPGPEEDYFYIHMWPKTPDNQKSYQGAKPYLAYINPKKGVMINPETFRNLDQKWRNDNFPGEFPKKWGLEKFQKDLKIDELPKAFFEALHASAIFAHLYYLVAKQYKEQQKCDAFPYTVGLDLNIQERTTQRILSHYMKPGDTIPVSKGDERLFALLGTPIGGIRPFMLAQSPEKIGVNNGDITDIEAHMGASGEIEYIKYQISSK